MQALRRAGGTLGLAEIAEPSPGPGEVVLRVALAGICRTDLFAAEGRIATTDPVTLGHELSGFVHSRGPGVTLGMGARITVAPALPCGQCAPCRAGRGCSRRHMLGVHADGAFADFVRVPVAAVHAVPVGLSLRHAAYVEPVAAALAVAAAPIARAERGLVLGDNRIAALTVRVLAARGFERIEGCGLDGARALADDVLDFAVETVPTSEALATLVRLVRPGGTIVLKSRPPEPALVDVNTVVQKQLTLHGALYGSFDEAVSLLATKALAVDDLLGETYALADYERAFAAARRAEAKKLFLRPGTASEEG